MILSHLSGIRHYERDAKKVRENKEKAKRLLKSPIKEETSLNKDDVKNTNTEENFSKESKQAKPTERKKEFEQEEYYLKTNFDNVLQALDLFKDDPLIFKPGEACVFKGWYLGHHTWFRASTWVNIPSVCRLHLLVLHPCLHPSQCRDGAGGQTGLFGSYGELVP